MLNMGEVIRKEHSEGKRCIAVMDITEFPFISGYLDGRNQRVVNADDLQHDAHSQAIVRTWEGYDTGKEIPLIVVNLNNTSTILKLLKIP